MRPRPFVTRRGRQWLTALILRATERAFAIADTRRGDSGPFGLVTADHWALLGDFLLSCVPPRRTDAWHRATVRHRRRVTPSAPAPCHPGVRLFPRGVAVCAHRPLREALSAGCEQIAALSLPPVYEPYLRGWRPDARPLTAAQLTDPTTVVTLAPRDALPPWTVQDVRRLLAPRGTGHVRRVFLGIAATHPNLLAAVLHELPALPAADHAAILDHLTTRIAWGGLVDLLWRAAGGDQSPRRAQPLTPTQCAWLRVLATTPLFVPALQRVARFDVRQMLVPDPADPDLTMALLSSPVPMLRAWAMTAWLPNVRTAASLPPEAWGTPESSQYAVDRPADSRSPHDGPVVPARSPHRFPHRGAPTR